MCRINTGAIHTTFRKCTETLFATTRTSVLTSVVLFSLRIFGVIGPKDHEDERLKVKFSSKDYNLRPVSADIFILQVLVNDVKTPDLPQEEGLEGRQRSQGRQGS